MKMRGTEIVPKATINELVGYRDRALAAYARICEETDALNKLIEPLNEHRYRLPTVTTSCDRGRSYYSTSTSDFRKELDAGCWDNILEKTEMRNLMGGKQKEALRAQLEKEPPEFTLENVLATFGQLRDDADTIFRQSLVDVFEALDRDFRSHDGFKLGARCCMKCAVGRTFGGGFQWIYWGYADKRSMLGDLDRALHKVAGEPWSENAADIAAKAMQDGETECETRFFRLRWFKNGNLHVWFTDKTATKEANRLLADHYGPRLGKMYLHPDERRAA
ncbi:MAG TPA: DUF4942 domain-containing protein [Pararhizobium sp.]|nr:DUF4942 domain-containing protein [Pararhizobium sp.]